MRLSRLRSDEFRPRPRRSGGRRIEVRKGGLPPLFEVELVRIGTCLHWKSGGKPPFPTSILLRMNSTLSSGGKPPFLTSNLLRNTPNF